MSGKGGRVEREDCTETETFQDFQHLLLHESELQFGGPQVLPPFLIARL